MPPHPCSALKKLVLNRVKGISDNGYFEISRPYVNIGDDESMTIYELHGLVTPTLKHAINVVYLRAIKLSGAINVKLVVAKCRVSYLNPHAIPNTDFLETYS